MLSVFQKLDAPVDPQNIEAYGSTMFRHISTIFLFINAIVFSEAVLRGIS